MARATRNPTKPINTAPYRTVAGPVHMLAMMESQARHAGEVMWADTMREAVAYFRRMVAENKLEKWRG